MRMVCMVLEDSIAVHRSGYPSFTHLRNEMREKAAATTLGVSALLIRNAAEGV